MVPGLEAKWASQLEQKWAAQLEQKWAAQLEQTRVVERVRELGDV
jgi:hypothetical protein